MGHRRQPVVCKRRQPASSRLSAPLRRLHAQRITSIICPEWHAKSGGPRCQILLSAESALPSAVGLAEALARVPAAAASAHADSIAAQFVAAERRPSRLDGVARVKFLLAQ